MRRVLILAVLLMLAPLASAGKTDPDRGYLGVSLQFVESIEKDGVPVQDGVGVFVQQVMPGGAADVAGLQREDRIVAIDGFGIEDIGRLKEKMAGSRLGERVSVTVERDDRERTFEVVLGEMPEKHLSVERFGVLLERVGERAFLGIESQPVEDQLAGYFGVEGGILVTRVVENTPAELAGIEAGDVIVSWGDTPLRGQNDVHELISRVKPGDEVELSISRKGVVSRTFVTLDEASGHIDKHLLRIQKDDLEKIHEADLRHYKLKVKESKQNQR